MRGLLAHARELGVSVHVAHLPRPYRGFYDSEQKRVVVGYDLTPIEQRSVLAHELGHAFYDHRCVDDARSEDAADFYAACLLIDPEAHARAEAIDPSQDAIAEELGVLPRLVQVWERRALTRVRGVTYVQARMGVGQYRWRWLVSGRV